MADVRMKGFGPRATVEQAEALVASRVRPLPAEVVPFNAASGRALAQPVRAAWDVPAHDKSAMDGYAVAAPAGPGTYAVVGQVTAAEHFPRALGSGEAVRIMTGARVPDGASAVVMVEESRLAGDTVELPAVEPGRHVLRRGEDLRAGEVVLPTGRRLRPQDVSLLVSAGALEVAVHRRPRVRIVPTGNELHRPGDTHPDGGGIAESNSYLLEALARRDGADPVLHPIVPDDRDALRRAFAPAGADVVVVTGGSSVGQEDYGPLVVAELGELPIHGIHVRPASPTGIGFIDGVPVVLAPGFPVASYVAWDLFVRPIVQRMLGLPPALPYRTRPARLARTVEKPAQRVEIQRVLVRDGEAHVLPGGAALLSTTTRADGFLLLPAGVASFAAGTVLDVYLYE